MDFCRSVDRIDGPGYLFELSIIPWDTEIFGYRVAQIDRIELVSNVSEIQGVDALTRWLTEHEVKLASCRLPSRSLRESMLLEQAGFRFVEMVYSPSLSPLPETEEQAGEIVFSPVVEDEVSEVESIAGTAFMTGRFILDHRLEAEASHRRYRKWVRNALLDSRQKIFTAKIGASMIGFFIFEEKSDGSVYWHLTAMSPDWQGKGLGMKVWAGMVALHRENGAAKIETTISAHNTAVMNIYAGLGFRFSSPSMTFHWAPPIER